LLNAEFIPWVIPYQKDSVVYFLKNGIDTVAFTCTNYSHGYETVILTDEDEGLCGSVKTEYIRAKMYAAENGDFFEIAYDNNIYHSDWNFVRVTYKNGTEFTTTYNNFDMRANNPLYSKPIKGKLYDSVEFVLSKFHHDTIMIKYPNSIVKISVGDVYELINIK
jgi:hypothetical protein